jgi:hypothetical protein
MRGRVCRHGTSGLEKTMSGREVDLIPVVLGVYTVTQEYFCHSKIIDKNFSG